MLVNAFWFAHSLLFHPDTTVSDQDHLLDNLASIFIKWLVSKRDNKNVVFKYFHYIIAKATYEAFLLVFPASREIFRRGAMKREIYFLILQLFLGDIMSFEFHIGKMKELFGEAEAKDILRAERKKQEEYSSKEGLYIHMKLLTYGFFRTNFVP